MITNDTGVNIHTSKSDMEEWLSFVTPLFEFLFSQKEFCCVKLRDMDNN